jgi:tRNA (guanine-N7-)-methyltransferase
MRFRPQNLRETDPVTFDRLVQNNPYLAKVHDYPELLLPYPTPEQFQALWKPKAKAVQRVHLEIGCGSGRYLSQWAARFPEDAFLGFELRFKRITLAAKKLQRNEQSNALLLRERGEFFDDYLQPGTLDVLHVNFPDPWPKQGHAKHRLLSQEFLTRLHPYFHPKGEVRFKTDHLDYFDWVSETFASLPRYHVTAHTRHLQASPHAEGNTATEFELLFRSKGDPPIGFLIAEVEPEQG